MAPLRLSFFFICSFLMAVPLYALTVEEVIRLKEAGVDEKTIQMLIEEGKARSLGVTEVERPEGGRDKIYYSITPPEEETSRTKEEKEKIEKSWEMLKNIMIDERKK
jgi:hypothetical protein